MPNDQDINLQESAKQVLQTLPAFLRDYITQGKYTSVARGLMSKYKLRLDQGGVLERELLFLLMGIENPTEFTKALMEDGNLDQQTVNSLVKDINEQVFIPLRKEEEALSKAAAVPQPPKPPVTLQQAQSRPAVLATQNVPRPTAAPAPHIAPLPPKVAMPTSATLGDIVRSITAPKPSGTKLLEDHEEPHIEIASAKPVASALNPEPVAPVAPAPEKPVDSIPAQRPLAPQPIAASTTTTEPAPGIPQITKVPPPSPITSYTSDPYREPLDEE